MYEINLSTLCPCKLAQLCDFKQCWYTINPPMQNFPKQISSTFDDRACGWNVVTKVLVQINNPDQLSVKLKL